MTPENPLEQVLVAAATEPDARPTFYRLMLDSPLYIINDDPEASGGPGNRMLRAGEQLMVSTVEIDGVSHTPIFSSVARLRAVLESERTYLAMQGRNLLEILRGSHLVLNPGSPFGKQFFPEEVEAMLSGDIFREYTTHTLEEQTEVLLGQPKVYPRHLTDALEQVFAELPDVKAAYLAHVVFSGADQPPHTMIGVDGGGDEKNWEGLMTAVTRKLKQVARPDDIVDVIRIDDSGVSKYMLDETKPFYERR